MVHDRGGSVASRYAPTKMPSSFILDRKGIVRHVHGGFTKSTSDQLAQEVETLLAEKP